jgi:methylamine dehydrogenase accessory protein MauD
MWLYSYLALWTLLLLISFLLIAVQRQLRELYGYWVKNDPEWGLPLGALAPAVSGEDAYGRPVSLAAGRGKKTLLFFLSPGCKSCRAAMGRVPSLREREDAQLILVVSATPLQTQLFLAGHRQDVAFPDVLAVADAKRELAEQYKVAAVPYSVVVDEDGRVGAKSAGWSLEEIDSLITAAEALRQRRQAREEGRELPLFSAEAGAAASEPAGV